jgi:hypothetical protein
MGTADGDAGFARGGGAAAGDMVADYLNSPAAAGLEGAGCGEALIALARIRSRLAGAQAGFLARFDAAGVPRRRRHRQWGAVAAVGAGDRRLDRAAAGREVARAGRPDPPGRRRGAGGA